MKHKKSIVIICCPTYENITEHDKQEIYNLLMFKERYIQAQKRDKEDEKIHH